jgi:hypothetical protein
MRIAFLLALLVPVPATAAAPSESDSARGMRASMHAYAKCVVLEQPAKVAEALAANLDNAATIRKYPMVFSPDCLGDAVQEGASMRFDGDLHRYVLADALVNRELTGWTMPDLAGVPPLSHRDPGKAPALSKASGKPLNKRKFDAAVHEYDVSATSNYLSRYGECVVRADAGDAKALLLSIPDTPQEAAAFDRLRPAHELCVAEGRTRDFGKVARRGAIAVNYYRLAHAARSLEAAK